MATHKLMTQEIRKSIPNLYLQDGKGDDAVAYVKYFAPATGTRWYATEFDPERNEFFGLVVVVNEPELGYFSLTEFEELNKKYKPRGLMPIQRDLYYKPTTIGKIKEKFCQGSFV